MEASESDLHSKSSAAIDETEQSTKSVFTHMWAAFSNSWKSLLIFMEQRVKINKNLYISNNIVPAFQYMKSQLKISLSPSNKMEPSHTSIKIKTGFRRSRHFARRCGRVHRLIRIQGIFRSMLKTIVSNVAHASSDALKTSVLI